MISQSKLYTIDKTRQGNPDGKKTLPDRPPPLDVISPKCGKIVITKEPTISFIDIIHFPRETIYNLRCFVAFFKTWQLRHKSQILNKNMPEKKVRF